MYVYVVLDQMLVAAMLMYCSFYCVSGPCVCFWTKRFKSLVCVSGPCAAFWKLDCFFSNRSHGRPHSYETILTQHHLDYRMSPTVADAGTSYCHIPEHTILTQHHLDYRMSPTIADAGTSNCHIPERQNAHFLSSHCHLLSLCYFQ
jgi:hypothetical protein